MLRRRGEKAVLLAHDLGRDLEDGPGALVEALDQPVGGLQAIGKKGLVGLVFAPLLRHARVVGLVDENARQGVRG